MMRWIIIRFTFTWQGAGTGVAGAKTAATTATRKAAATLAGVGDSNRPTGAGRQASWITDGEVDCGDGSDETAVPFSQCAAEREGSPIETRTFFVAVTCSISAIVFAMFNVSGPLVLLNDRAQAFRTRKMCAEIGWTQPFI